MDISHIDEDLVSQLTILATSDFDVILLEVTSLL